MEKQSNKVGRKQSSVSKRIDELILAGWHPRDIMSQLPEATRGLINQRRYWLKKRFVEDERLAPLRPGPWGRDTGPIHIPYTAAKRRGVALCDSAWVMRQSQCRDNAYTHYRDNARYGLGH